MTEPTWMAFRNAITTELTTVYGTGTGRGEWDGVGEDTFFAVGIAGDVDALRARLAHLAAQYKQDAIGCVAMAGTDSAVMAVAP